MYKKEYIGQLFTEQKEVIHKIKGVVENVEEKQDSVTNLIWDISDQAKMFNDSTKKISKAA